jgi:hypothetical protein
MNVSLKIENRIENPAILSDVEGEILLKSSNADYPNTFSIVDDGFKKYKTFRLRYRYKSGSITIPLKFR